MAAIVTDQFRIQNAEAFVNSVNDDSNSYYVFLGLSNPGLLDKFGRLDGWDDSSNAIIPSPVDNFSYLSHYRDTILFGKKITGGNVRRVVKKITWTANTKYDMYRHDYDVNNLAQNSDSSRLYSSNFYVVNKDFRVYICLYNGSSGSNPKGETSQDEPLFTDLEPSAAGNSNDGYIWKYLFTISPSDIIKFDSTEYIILPNDWATSTDFEIKSIRESGNSTDNFNQIKIVYIKNSGNANYVSGSYPILGDGEGGEVQITANSSGQIVSTKVINGGRGYTFGIVDLGSNSNISQEDKAELIPIIPPSKGHGYDIYRELGADKVLIYSRFDTSIKEFSANTKFAQVGIIKNPEEQSSSNIFKGATFSGLHSIKLQDTISVNPEIGGQLFQQRVSNESQNNVGWAAAFDPETNILKYYQDRSLYLTNGLNNVDSNLIVDQGQVYPFESSDRRITQANGFSGSVSIGFSGSTLDLGNSIVGLGVSFVEGLAKPEINKGTGDIIYIDNRSIVSRSIRQKEDVKIILEF
jgi:hypothetical protein